MLRKMLIAATVALAAALSLPSLASARTNVAVGIGDQGVAMFDNPSFLAMKVKKARYFVSWKAMSDPRLLGAAEAWVDAARRRGVRPLLHVDGHFTTKLPSVKEYRSSVGALVRHFRQRGVTEWGAWNEVNSKTQPTWRNPKRVAQYFLAMRKLCKGCTIVALDILDSGSMKGYIQRFYRALGKRRGLAKIVGIHNYGDTNRRRNNTAKIIAWTRRYNRRTQFWLTETGGIALLQSEKNGRLVQTRGLKCNPKRPRKAERRQAKAITHMFRLARKHRRHVKRLYSYNFYGTDCDTSLRFDSGLIRRDGSKRPAYRAFRKALRGFKR